VPPNPSIERTLGPMSSVRAERLAANIDGDFVVFLIGMRINSLVRVHRWLPVATAMPRMLKELQRRPELGLLHYEIWGGRTTLVLQYWRSIEQLLAYAQTGRPSTCQPGGHSIRRLARTER